MSEKKEHLINFALLFAAPLLLLLVNGNWFFTQMALVDSWTYVSVFLNYGSAGIYDLGYVADGLGYKEARFHWTMPAAAAYQALDPVTATNLLGLGFLYIAVFSLYACLSFLFDRRTAFVTAFLFLVYMELQGSYGWAYHNNAAIAFSFLALALLLKAWTKDNSSGLLFCAGAAWAAIFTTCLIFLPAAVLILFVYISVLFINDKKYLSNKIWTVFRSIIIVIFGAVITLYYYW